MQDQVEFGYFVGHTGEEGRIILTILPGLYLPLVNDCLMMKYHGNITLVQWATP